MLIIITSRFTTRPLTAARAYVVLQRAALLGIACHTVPAVPARQDGKLPRKSAN